MLWLLPSARSAGRVQSVMRLVPTAELKIEKFVAREYWSLVETLATPRRERLERAWFSADGREDHAARYRFRRRGGKPSKQALETAAFTVDSVE